MQIGSPSKSQMDAAKAPINSGAVASNATGAGGNAASEQAKATPSITTPTTQPGQPAPNSQQPDPQKFEDVVVTATRIQPPPPPLIAIGSGAISYEGTPRLPTITVRPPARPLPIAMPNPIAVFVIGMLMPGNLGDANRCIAAGCGCGTPCMLPPNPGFGDATGIRGPTMMDSTKPPADATDPNGAKAPGMPGEVEGYQPPKNGPQWVRNPNGKGYGWVDAGGKVWVPTGPGPLAHGGAHWDVQIPGGGYINVYPGGKAR